MSYFQIISIALGAFLSKSLSFRVGNKTVTATDTNGQPIHLTFAQALAAVEAVLVGQTGTVQIGNIQVSIQ